jgi:hypothetical protein
MVKYRLKPRHGKSQLIVFISELVTFIIFMAFGPIAFYIFICGLVKRMRVKGVRCKVKGFDRMNKGLKKANNQLKEEVRKGIKNL